ncbi:Inactive Rhomboid Protein 2 [Manis pentadactyla]|nr:Inactive Rhomboid Protein 2 [Manis pentadactyla]
MTIPALAEEVSVLPQPDPRQPAQEDGHVQRNKHINYRVTVSRFGVSLPAPASPSPPRSPSSIETPRPAWRTASSHFPPLLGMVLQEAAALLRFQWVIEKIDYTCRLENYSKVLKYKDNSRTLESGVYLYLQLPFKVIFDSTFSCVDVPFSWSYSPFPSQECLHSERTRTAETAPLMDTQANCEIETKTAIS